MSTNYTTDASLLVAIQGGKNGQFTIVQVGNFTTSQTYATTNPGAGLFGSDQFTVYTTPHFLPYIPSVMAYELTTLGQYSPLPYVQFKVGTSAQALWFNYSVTVDATNIYLVLQTMTYGNVSWSFATGFTFKWYLLKQTAN